MQSAARLLALALLLAILAALLGYTLHYWTVQGSDLTGLGGRWRSWLRHPLSRARRVTLAYAGFGEKLVLAALLLGLLLSLSAWAWTGRVQERLLSPVLNAGTYGGAWFYDGLDRLGLSGNPADIALIRGLASQLSGDTALLDECGASAPGNRLQLFPVVAPGPRPDQGTMLGTDPFFDGHTALWGSLVT